MRALNGRLRWILSGAIWLFSICAAFAQGLAADPAEWRLLSRVHVNPPEIQAFVETFFSYNQLKSDTGGELVLGFAAVSEKRKDTDVLVSRFVRSEDRWTAPVSIAGSTDLERSPAIWIDGASDTIHAAWVGNKRQKPGGHRSELRLGYRRSQDGGGAWTPARHFPVGTALARRPHLMGDGRGNLYLAVSNGYPEGQERIHLLHSVDGGGAWGPVDVNFPEDKKRGDTLALRMAVGSGGSAYLVWLDPTVGRSAVVFTKAGANSTWSSPVRLNDDPAANCTEPRLAVQGDSVYVVWRVVKGDRTILYFDHSRDGGANWNSDQVIVERPALSVRTSLQPLGGSLLAGWFESVMRKGQTGHRLSYRFYSPSKGWTFPEGERDSLAGDHGSGRFYYGFALLPWKDGCLVAYSKASIGISPEIFLAWSEDLRSGFSELMKISEPKTGFEHLYPRLVRSGENEVAVVYNRRKIRRSPMEPRVILGDVLVARVGVE